jgi:RNA polymerase sigma factor (sigma-70 family)
MEAMMISGNTAATREAFFTVLYKKAFPAISKYVSRMGGSFEEAKDVFQDALVIYYEKIVALDDVPGKSDKAYLLGIAKHLWLKKYRDNNMNVPLVDFDQGILDEEETKPLTEKLMHYLETSGQKCMEILKAFYYDKLPVKQLADLFGYSSIRSATVQKYKCLEKVRDRVKQKSLSYEDFLE